MEAQLKTFETDMQDFKNVNKKYRDQLIKVKVTTAVHGFLATI